MHAKQTQKEKKKRRGLCKATRPFLLLVPINYYYYTDQMYQLYLTC